MPRFGSVLVPEIWITFAEEAGIPELKRTTHPTGRLRQAHGGASTFLAGHGLACPTMRAVIAKIDPMPGPRVWTSCTASPRSSSSPTLSNSSPSPSWKLGWPTLFCNETGGSRRWRHHRLHDALPRVSSPRCALHSCGIRKPSYAGDSHNDLGMILDSKGRLCSAPPMPSRPSTRTAGHGNLRRAARRHQGRPMVPFALTRRTDPVDAAAGSDRRLPALRSARFPSRPKGRPAALQEANCGTCRNLAGFLGRTWYLLHSYGRSTPWK